MNALPHRAAHRRRPRRRRRRGRRLRRRWSSATGSRCAGSPCRCSRRGRAPLRVLQVSRPAPHPGPAAEDRVGARAGRRCEPDLVVNTGDNLAAPRRRAAAAAGDGAAARASPGRSSWAPTTTSRRCRRTRPATSPARTPRHRSAAADLPVALVEGLRDAAAGPTSTTPATVADDGRHDVELVGVDDPHIGYDRYADGRRAGRRRRRADVGLVHAPYQRVLDAMVGRRRRPGPRRPHPRRPARACPLWGALVTNCDLDTRRAKGVSRWWPGAGRRSRRRCAVVAAPADAAWLHVSAGLGTSPYAPVRFACRPEATLLTLVAARRLTRVPATSRALGPVGRTDFGGRGGRLSSGVAAPVRRRRHCHGVWRSLVARFVRDEEAAGSNPVTPTVELGP